MRFFAIRFLPINLMKILVLTAALGGMAWTCNPSEGSTPPAEPQSLKSHIDFLADKDLEGRNTGSEGIRRAGEYIRQYWQDRGVRPFNGSYFQEFSVTVKVELSGENHFAFTNDNGKVKLNPAEDYTPLPLSGNGDASGALVFAGYGISLKDGSYDDYSGLDVTDKIVVMFRSSPDHRNPHGKFAEYAPIHYKLSNARAKGAAAVILISPSQMGDDLMRLHVPLGAQALGIPAVQLRRQFIDDILPTGRRLQQLEDLIAENRQPVSFELPETRVELSTELSFIDAPARNVVGLVAGSNPDLKDEYIIVGAHYDHIGWGEYGSRYNGEDKRIHHGADDNASGTSALMDLAARIAAKPLPRPVIFLAFSGEEMGLLGSKHYCDNPLVPLDNTVMMLNMDMIGRLQNNTLTVTGTGTADRWTALLDSLEKVFPLSLSRSADGFGASDHSSFTGKNIPVLNLFSGLHGDYHRPEDTPEKINYEGLEMIRDFAMSIIVAVADNKIRPAFTQQTTKTANSGSRMSFSVSVGTIPDYSDHPRGMRITGVKQGSPAQKGGLKAGDVIIQFGDQKIDNIYDYTYALGLYKPQDVVEVIVLRGENEENKVSLNITLTARQSSTN